MTLERRGFGVGTCLLAVVTLSAQVPEPQTPEQQPDRPTFTVQVDLVTADVVIRDQDGNFVSDLKPEEFEVFEDGVLQDLVTMTVVTGGRVFNPMVAPPAPVAEGIILPQKRRVSDISGRIFLFFVDDHHLQFANTGRVRELFKKISRELVHDGDLWGMVSSGPSSIAIDLTYDRKRLDEVIDKITGNELKAYEIINGASGSRGPSEVRYRAQVAFATMADLLKNLEAVHNRRKALIWVSDGYDFNPYADSRFGLLGANSPFEQNALAVAQSQAQQSAGGGATVNPRNDPLVQQQMQNEEFADAELAGELWELTRSANRANTTIYTIDPRGLVGPMADLDENVDPRQWNEFVRKSQDSLRVLAEDTGGVAVVNTNDFDKALKRIDAETSDYYVLGYYSKNSDLTRRRRRIDVRVTRPDMSVWARREYVLRPQPAPASPEAAAPARNP
jgi:VWFA-related protein